MEKKKTRKRYPKEYKYEVLSYYYSHGEQRRKTYEKFGIAKSMLLQWIKAYPIEGKGVSLQSEIEDALQMNQPQNPETQDSLRRRIEALERALEYERLRCRGYERLIEIAEREEGISILKKDGAKQ
jgi:transposase-like protein